MGVPRHLSLLWFNLFLDNYLTGAGASESVNEAIGRLSVLVLSQLLSTATDYQRPIGAGQGGEAAPRLPGYVCRNSRDGDFAESVLGLVHTGRIERHKADTTVYGISTDNMTWNFYRIDNHSKGCEDTSQIVTMTAL